MELDPSNWSANFGIFIFAWSAFGFWSVVWHITCFVRMTSLLLALIFYLFSLWQFKDGDLWKIPDKGIPCLTHHLKTVEILEFYGNENQLELVRFILKYGQVLQKMSITWGYSGVKYPIKISRQVKEFPRLSPTAALEFLEPFYEWFDHFGLWTRNTKENIWRKSILIRKNVVDSYLCICIHVF